MPKVLLPFLVLLGLLFIGCGDDDRKRKGDPYVQDEDALQLTNDQMFSLKDFTSVPSDLLAINSSEFEQLFQQSKFFTDRSVQERISNVARSASLQKRNLYTKQTKRADEFQTLKTWPLQDNVEYDKDRQTLVVRLRQKVYGTTGTDSRFIFLNYQNFYKCDSESLENLAGTSAVDLVDSETRADLLNCPESDLQSIEQELRIDKIRTAEGMDAKFERLRAHMAADGFCREDSAGGMTVVNCGEFLKTKVSMTENGQTQYQTNLFQNFTWSDVTYSPGMKFYNGGSAEFRINDWSGFVGFDSTGDTGTLTISNDSNPGVYADIPLAF